MRTLRQTSLLLLVVFPGIAACLLPSIIVTNPNALATSLAKTVTVALAQTQLAASITQARASEPPPSIASPSQTLTYSQSVTPTVSYTRTPAVPQISVTVPTNCRTGPGKVFDLVGALLVGETAEIFGRHPAGTYWYIRNPDAPNQFCWIWGQYAILSGPTESVPIFTPRPTPTPTFTPTPVPGFDATYEGLVSCPPLHWPQIRLENTGTVTFRSVGILLKDTVTSTSVSSSMDGFTNRKDCTTITNRSTLLPAKAAMISAPELAYDPTGHKLRATITLCSKTGLNGICVSETITFKP